MNLKTGIDAETRWEPILEAWAAEVLRTGCDPFLADAGAGRSGAPAVPMPRPSRIGAEARALAEQGEPVVRLAAMPEGGEVVEDYCHVGLTLRQHPVASLRADLAWLRFVTCAEAMASRDRRWLEVAGLVLVRQRLVSAKGVMFITIEDETGVANLVVSAKVFEAHRKIVLGAGMMGVRGRIQREGEVVHLLAHSLSDLTAECASVGRRGRASDSNIIEAGELRTSPRMPMAKEMFDPHGRIVDEIRVRTRNFR